MRQVRRAGVNQADSRNQHMSDQTQDRDPWPRVGLTGSSGFIGQRLSATLRARGYRVDEIVRRPPAPGTTQIEWHPERGEIDAASLAGVDAVVNLAGENIGAERWTSARKAALESSRVAGTRLLSETLARLSPRPKVLISASAIGYYGDRGDEPLDEQSAAGRGFLPEVCQRWEAACEPARQAGIRVVNPRIGLVLSGEGGALARMLTPFKLGFGGVIGHGRQYVSWITITDLLRCFEFLLDAPDLAGPINVVAPSPVTNAEFTKALGRVLRRPTLAPVPAFAVRLIFGEMGEALLLASTRVLPKRLETAGFTWLYPTLEAALRQVLVRAGPV